MILKLGMQHLGLKVYEVYIIDDPRLTLTYYTTMSNLVINVYYAYSMPRCKVSIYTIIFTNCCVRTRDLNLYGIELKYETEY